MTTVDQYASVRCLVQDVQAAIDFSTEHLGFGLNTSAAPTFADVTRGPLRLLLSGPASSGARAAPSRHQHRRAQPQSTDGPRVVAPARSNRRVPAEQQGREMDAQLVDQLLRQTRRAASGQ